MRSAPGCSFPRVSSDRMSMTELNNMAKELGVENFGTMRKHEVIFHILEKNAQRAGVLFSEGVIRSDEHDGTEQHGEGIGRREFRHHAQARGYFSYPRKKCAARRGALFRGCHQIG